MRHAKELFSLDGRVAIVTGGRGLYGAGISEGLCEMGATVVIASRNGEKCEELAGELRAKGHAAIGLALDLSDDASIAAFVKKVMERYGKIDVLVNNAVDRRNMTSLANATREKLRDSAEVNLNGQILLSQAVIPYMIDQGGGSIINISSMRGLDSPHFPFYPEAMGDQPVNYTTEKWAMVGMTKYMAGRYGKHKIRVNCIAPGATDTEMFLTVPPEIKAASENSHPMKRLARPEEQGEVIAFLASERASYLSGQWIPVSGGK